MPRRLIALFTNPRVVVAFFLGLSSALPLALTAGTLQAWLATEQLDIRTIGWFTLVGLPYTWKFLWAPLFDRFTLHFLGPRRGWLLLLQLAICVGLIVLGFIPPREELATFAAMAIAVAFLSASQDIVIDAYRTEILRPEERGPGAAAVTFGGRLGLLLSGAGALILADHMPWHLVYAIMAGGMALTILATLFGPEPEATILHPRTLRSAVLDPWRDFLQRRGAILTLLFVTLYKFGDAFSVALATPFFLEVGFTKTQIGTAFKGIGMIATILGALVGGAITTRIGIVRSLWFFGILQAVSNLGFIALDRFGANFPLLLGVIGFDQFCGGLGTTAFVAFLMALCNRRFTATQYALLSSVMSLARVTVGAPAGYVVAAVGWTWFFVASMVMALPGLVLLLIVVRLQDPETTTGGGDALSHDQSHD